GSTTNSGNISYNWNTDSGNIASNFSDSIVVDDSGNYQLKVTDPDNGCIDSLSKVVDIDTGEAFASITGNDTLTCTKSTDTLDGSSSTTNSEISITAGMLLVAAFPKTSWTAL
ncbi:MAG: hypothetical protein ABEH43_00735, partial [Flavobacteriales bacterium]